MLRLETGKFLGENKRVYEADGLTVSETLYRRRVFEGWHAHENYHLTLILRGGNRERRKGTEIQSTPGRVLFYSRGELHRNTGTQHPSKNINLEIGTEFLSKYQAAVPAFGTNSLQSAKIPLLKIYKECLTMDAQTFDLSFIFPAFAAAYSGRGLIALDELMAKADAARNDRRRQGLRKLIEKIEQKYKLSNDFTFDETVEILQNLTSFEFFDQLAGPARTPEEVVPVVQKIIFRLLCLQLTQQES